MSRLTIVVRTWYTNNENFNGSIRERCLDVLTLLYLRPKDCSVATYNT